MSGLLSLVGFRKRRHVGISLAGNNFIELVCIDRKTKKVMNYASGNIKYNSAMREIIDYDEFREVLESLFQDANLEPRECCVTLNLPNVQFGIHSIDPTSQVSREWLRDEIQESLSDLYIFKRNEAKIDFAELPRAFGRSDKLAVYSAIQEKVVSQIENIFESLEIELTRIENSYSAMLKTLQYCDRFERYFYKGESTQIVLVTSNSCNCFYMVDNILADYSEDLVGVKSLSGEEVYTAVATIAQKSLNNTKSSFRNLIVISEADEVNAEILSQYLKVDESVKVEYINKNLAANDEFIEVSPNNDNGLDDSSIEYITLESVGAAISDYDEFPVNINLAHIYKKVSQVITIGEYEIEFIKFIIILLLLAVIGGVILGSIISTILGQLSSSKSGIQSQQRAEIESINKKIENMEKNQKNNIFPVLSKIVKSNNDIVNVYAGLSSEIPSSIYIKKFVTNEKGGIGILGESKTSESVQDFVKGLREKNGDLMVSKLSVNSQTDLTQTLLPDGYTFEIKTSQVDVNLDENIDLLKNLTQNSNNENTNNDGGSLPPAPLI